MIQPPVKVAIVGLGGRGGNTYASYAERLANKMKIVAVADPIKSKRDRVAEDNNIPENMRFETAEDLLAQDKLADVLFVCTQDQQHYAQAVAGIKKGYHIVLEKPISPSNQECADIVKVAKEYNRKVIVCHVLRYTPFFQKIKEIIDSGEIGEVVSINAMENVQYWHQAHSYVRGNWADTTKSSPMILAKSCHDLDILLWLTGKECRYLSSFGDLFLFKKDKAPEGAAERCVDCKLDCPYDARKIYITNKKTGVAHGKKWWPSNIVVADPTVEKMEEALKTSPYGRCVYHCKNNAVDHQVVNMELDEGVTISFTMCAFTSTGGRTLKVMGTMGDIQANMDENIVDVGVFGEEHQIYDIGELAEDLVGHGGGDIRMVEDFLDYLIADEFQTSTLTSIEKSVESHYVAMAAEYSRLHHGQSISMKAWKEDLETNGLHFKTSDF